MREIIYAAVLIAGLVPAAAVSFGAFDHDDGEELTALANAACTDVTDQTWRSADFIRTSGEICREGVFYLARNGVRAEPCHAEGEPMFCGERDGEPSLFLPQYFCDYAGPAPNSVVRLADR